VKAMRNHHTHSSLHQDWHFGHLEDVVIGTLLLISYWFCFGLKKKKKKKMGDDYNDVEKKDMNW
jgi:hypothetical protein